MNEDAETPQNKTKKLQVGKWADLVLWSPAFFGAKPEMVLKGGFIAWSQVRLLRLGRSNWGSVDPCVLWDPCLIWTNNQQMGDPNASIPTPEPVFMRPMYGGAYVNTHMTCHAITPLDSTRRDATRHLTTTRVQSN